MHAADIPTMGNFVVQAIQVAGIGAAAFYRACGGNVATVMPHMVSDPQPSSAGPVAGMPMPTVSPFVNIPEQTKTHAATVDTGSSHESKDEAPHVYGFPFTEKEIAKQERIKSSAEYWAAKAQRKKECLENEQKKKQEKLSQQATTVSASTAVLITQTAPSTPTTTTTTTTVSTATVPATTMQIGEVVDMLRPIVKVVEVADGLKRIPNRPLPADFPGQSTAEKVATKVAERVVERVNDPDNWEALQQYGNTAYEWGKHHPVTAIIAGGTVLVVGGYYGGKAAYRWWNEPVYIPELAIPDEQYFNGLNTLPSDQLEGMKMECNSWQSTVDYSPFPYDQYLAKNKLRYGKLIGEELELRDLRKMHEISDEENIKRLKNHNTEYIKTLRQAQEALVKTGTNSQIRKDKYLAARAQHYLKYTEQELQLREQASRSIAVQPQENPKPGLSNTAPIKLAKSHGERGAFRVSKKTARYYEPLVIEMPKPLEQRWENLIHAKGDKKGKKPVHINNKGGGGSGNGGPKKDDDNKKKLAEAIKGAKDLADQITDDAKKQRRIQPLSKTEAAAKIKDRYEHFDNNIYRLRDGKEPIRTLDGKPIERLEWDYNHFGEWEAYADLKGKKHLGALDPETLQLYKKGDPSRFGNN